MARAPKGPKGMSPDDKALWDAYVQNVKRVSDANRNRAGPDVPMPAPPPVGLKKPAKPVARPPLIPATKPKSVAKPAAQSIGLDPRTRRKVTRGRIGIDARIDLHGMRQTEAHQALVGFIRSAAMRGDKTVLVITGKGRASMDDAPWWEAREKGALRRLVPVLLRQRELSPYVIGYEAASQAHGGEGALYVRLRRPKR